MSLRAIVRAAAHNDAPAEEASRDTLLREADASPAKARATLALIARDLRSGDVDATGEQAAALLRIARKFLKAKE